MRRLVLPLAVITIALLAIRSAPRPAAAESIRIEAVVWQLNKDYPGADPNDANLPFHGVYIKTHDGTDWMATYDHNPLAVSGPDAIRNLINIYGQQGIDVAAWFVPTGRDVNTQVQLAEQVLDSGVMALYADVEPFDGFCSSDCQFLAEAFWQRLRAERPQAKLGVIYDPRPWWWGPADVGEWLAVADVAAPMCFWEDYVGQSPWADPGGCVFQAHQDLSQIAPGKTLEYAPMLQGDTTPDRFKPAVDAALAVGAQRVSVWRRGVVSADLWQAIRGYGDAPTPCWVLRADNCVVRETSSSSVYLLEAGAKFLVPDVATLSSIGISDDVKVVPDGFLSLFPNVPRDGTLLAADDWPNVYLVSSGARFQISSPADLSAMGLDPAAIHKIPAAALGQVPPPAQYSRLQESNNPQQYAMIGATRMPLDAAQLAALVATDPGKVLYVVPNGALKAIPLAAPPVRGDVNCDGAVDTLDALADLQISAGLPSLGLCAAQVGNVNCDAGIDTLDALALLRYTAGLPINLPKGCPPIG